ncbi:ATP-dependent DNA helicase RecG [Anaerosolibacter carboniphilus]|uniref:ATP-dependent DNA helicase RecG n=1 Tax=Anaerosolibacter carboniphilus TaxID=1417629 RepID=A0A841L5Z7_9FIRM|nr:ATP-dependent DNA helicase RecG [Anaerosolibacter carboniphilus]MBB6217829.1 ATP-dependent DNA helicase RecG [Anaerosolibacter carboniphilus]
MSELKKTVQFLKGIGPAKYKRFQKLGIDTIEDLLYTFPREYEDRRHIESIKNLKNEEKASLRVIVQGDVEKVAVKRNFSIYKLPVRDASGTAYAVFYNTPYVQKSFSIGEQIYLNGKVKIAFGEIQILHPEYEFANNKERNLFERILPVYSLTEGLSQNDFISIQKQVLHSYLDLLNEYLPQDTVLRNRLCDIHYAIRNIHFPQSPQHLKVAKYRLVFEELLILQLGLSLTKSRLIMNQEGISFERKPELYKFIDTLPYKLTNAQRKVLDEIENDMEQEKTMNRLIQGDVGSGKTIIALIALYKAILNGYQGALMAPTEILAEQHLHSARELLEPLGVKIALLSGSIPKRKKEEILKRTELGEIDLLIGTHAIIQENVTFYKLGIAITDEQHRFGVRQRAVLSSKGLNPDILVMTATPIPRTLALILYGDLDISTIDELPPGRKKIKTMCIQEERRRMAYDFAKNQITEGRQVYIVCPLIEESESIEAKSALDIFEEVSTHYLKDFRIGLLHGKMKGQEKEAVMNEFKSGKLDVLVSTTVIEVGVNVPNASVMIIENSERFGLAQLHQLRGRVGRGVYQSYCILICNSKNDRTKERMQVMEQSENGFIIAEKDLELRGPGDFFGTRQHGIPELKIANLFKHIHVLKHAQKEAAILLEEDKALSLGKNIALRRKLVEKFKDTLGEISL